MIVHENHISNQSQIKKIQEAPPPRSSHWQSACQAARSRPACRPNCFWVTWPWSKSYMLTQSYRHQHQTSLFWPPQRMSSRLMSSCQSSPITLAGNFNCVIDAINVGYIIHFDRLNHRNLLPAPCFTYTEGINNKTTSAIRCVPLQEADIHSIAFGDLNLESLLQCQWGRAMALATGA